MIVLPGPAFLFIPLGLAILSLEFAWAEKLLLKAMEEGAEGKDLLVQKLKGRPWLTQAAIAFGILSLLLIVALFLFII